MKKLLLGFLMLMSGCMGSFDHAAMATSIAMPYCNQNTGDTILATHWNGNCSTVQSFLNNQNLDGTTNIAVGGIQTANLANLSVTDAKIAGITTAGKVNGSSITQVNNIPSGAGTIPTVNLGSGTANSTSYLRGDQTWQPSLVTSVSAYGTNLTSSTPVTSGLLIAYGGPVSFISANPQIITNLPFTSSSSYVVMCTSDVASNSTIQPCNVFINSGSQFTIYGNSNSVPAYWYAIGT